MKTQSPIPPMRRMAIEILQVVERFFDEAGCPLTDEQRFYIRRERQCHICGGLVDNDGFCIGCAYDAGNPGTSAA